MNSLKQSNLRTDTQHVGASNTTRQLNDRTDEENHEVLNGSRTLTTHPVSGTF